MYAKKRPARAVFPALCLFLAVLLLPWGAHSAGAAQNVHFVAIDDVLPFELSYSTMPYWEGGVLYVTYNVFEYSTLGIYVNFDQTDWILSLYNSNHRLDFYISDGFSYDGNGNIYTEKALMSNSKVFVPAKFVCQFFGLGFSNITEGTQYPIARIKTGSQVYSDSTFAAQAASKIATRASTYLNSTTQSPPPTVSPPPSAPVTAPPGGRSAALWIDTGGEVPEELLKALEDHGFGATFFFKASDIDEALPGIRTVWGKGFGLALTAAEDEAAASLSGANDLLDRSIHIRTRLCSLSSGAHESTVTPLGYIPVEWDLDGDLYFSGGFGGVLGALPANETPVIRFTLTEQSLESILRALGELNRADFRVLPVRETT
ncbi:MAG: hypothetical protein GXX89_09050 [Clostridiales bacterium]|nr:hypothetical protein [Clostridiales bacterium]